MNPMMHAPSAAQDPKATDTDGLHGLARLLKKGAASEPASAPSHTEPPRAFTATVTQDLGDGGFELLCEDGERLQARRAFDCLLVPRPQDRIHGIRAGHDTWILHILERQDRAAETLLRPPGAARVRIECESLLLQAHQSLHLQADALMESAVAKTTVVKTHHSIDAGSLGVHVDNHLSLKGELATLNASALIKMDAAQIHMG